MIRTTSRQRAAALTSAMGVSGMVLLAGCTPGPADAETKTETTAQVSQAPATSGSSSSSSTPETSAAASTKYADGTYSANGSYSPKAGLIEEISVTLTIANDAVTDVEITSTPKERETQEYQSKFIGGISDEVVGKAIDDLNVSRVAGSSLTSEGFNKALDTIKAEATS